MGGDDLGSDDEYLVQDVKDTAVDELVREVAKKQDFANKRKRQESAHIEHEDDEHDNNDDATSSAKKKKKKSSPEALFLEAGRNLEKQSTEEQASFLSASLRHYSMLETNKDPEISLAEENFVASDKESLVQRLKDGISVKKLKKGKHAFGSPTVVIICQSARRAVAILKECSALNIRVAKLFPKNGTVESQLTSLRTTAFGLAVSTPHRLQVLCQAENGLNLFNKTRLVVLDCHASPKGFTVCTLPDTAPHSISLLRDFVVPELKRRKDMRLAFF